MKNYHILRFMKICQVFFGLNNSKDVILRWSNLEFLIKVTIETTFARLP